MTMAAKLSLKLLFFAGILLFAGMSCQFLNQIGQPKKEIQMPTLDFSPRRSLVVKPDQLPAARIGQAYEAQITVEQTETPVGDFVLSKGELPPGLVLEKVKGENIATISGTPKKVGTYKFLISMWCYGTNKSGQSAEIWYTIDVTE